MKEYINSNAKTISMNKINEESIIHAVLEMKRLLENNNFLNNIPDLLEDFSIVNENVFKFEENVFMKIIVFIYCQCYLVYYWI